MNREDWSIKAHSGLFVMVLERPASGNGRRNEVARSGAEVEFYEGNLHLVIFSTLYCGKLIA